MRNASLVRHSDLPAYRPADNHNDERSFAACRPIYLFWTRKYVCHEARVINLVIPQYQYGQSAIVAI